MNLPPDIEQRISENFRDPQRAKTILSLLQVVTEKERIIRCVLVLSSGDYDSLSSWVKKANADYRDVILYAEYDNREVRVYDFNLRFDEQIPCSYE